jgi:EAL domain-containing protein (putative c-di-GMP-specific phosphodiesterase class I)
MVGIDYTFIVNVLEDEQDQIMVNSTINMAHSLDLSVVAEGVEKQAVLNTLTSM